MVNEPRINVKNDFFTADLQTIYDSLCSNVRMHKGAVYMACCAVAISVGYILYGRYPRKVIDARITEYRNGTYEIETVTKEKFMVQRLKHKECGHTHALMFEFFIPYRKYSVRFVLLHLHRYFSMNISIEAYCLENNIPISTFRRWMKWLKENMSLLTEFGLVRNQTENRNKLNEWMHELMDDTKHWILKSLSALNLVLFQERGMPAGYLNYMIKEFKKI